MTSEQVSSNLPRLRVAICWPAPRLDRIKVALADPSLYEQMDGLSYLQHFGIDTLVIDSSKGWKNPFARHGSLLAGIDPWRFVRQLWLYRKYDALISVDSSSAFLFTCVKRILRLKKPVLVIDPALDPNYKNRMRLHDLTLPYVEAVLVFGQVQVDFLRQRYGNRVRAEFVRHRMDCRFFDPAKVSNIPPLGAPYMVSVGNDVGRDFESLVAAVDGLPIQLIIHTRRTIQRPLPANVQVQSHWISFEQLRDLYGRATVIVVPLHDTLHASGTNSLLEALAIGRPVVVSGGKGIIDYVEHRRTAWVVPPGDPASIRSAIEHLLANKSEAEELGEHARKYCLEKLAMNVYAGIISHRIKRICQARVDEQVSS